MIDDQVPKVRMAAAWMYFRMTLNCFQLIFASEENLRIFMEKALHHMQDHYRIAILLSQAFSMLFEKADLLNAK